MTTLPPHQRQWTTIEDDCSKTRTTAQKQWQTPQNEHKWWPTHKNSFHPQKTNHSPQTTASAHEWTQATQTDDKGPGQWWGTRTTMRDKGRQQQWQLLSSSLFYIWYCKHPTSVITPQLMQRHHHQPPTLLPLPNGKVRQHVSGHITTWNETTLDNNDTDKWHTVTDNNEQWWWTNVNQKPMATNDRQQHRGTSRCHLHHVLPWGILISYRKWNEMNSFHSQQISHSWFQMPFHSPTVSISFTHGIYVVLPWHLFHSLAACISFSHAIYFICSNFHFIHLWHLFHL